MRQCVRNGNVLCQRVSNFKDRSCKSRLASFVRVLFVGSSMFCFDSKRLFGMERRSPVVAQIPCAHYDEQVEPATAWKIQKAGEAKDELPHDIN
mmetsp:Transcript_20772/g.52307  ORF Transcript_20772/g.52307 Transcript_20772/m.52307 type:complete len:94 (-) Transcript_20772:18-299(-)